MTRKATRPLFACTIPILGGLSMAAFAATALSAHAQDHQRTILPGYWEYTNRLSFIFDQTKVERRCIGQRDVDKFLAGPSNKHYVCTYPVRRVGGGRAYFKGTCVNKHGEAASITASGSYEPTRFHLDAQLQTTLAGLPISPTGSIDARRLSDTCPEGAPAN